MWDFLASGGIHKTTPLSFSVVISTSLKAAVVFTSLELMVSQHTEIETSFSKFIDTKMYM